MDELKIPVKYRINVWKSLTKYPTKMDVLYEIISHVTKMKGDEFSEQTLNGIWYDSDGVANWRGTDFEKMFDALITDGYVEESRTEEKSGKRWYVIAKNPWI